MLDFYNYIGSKQTFSLLEKRIHRSGLKMFGTKGAYGGKVTEDKLQKPYVENNGTFSANLQSVVTGAM